MCCITAVDKISHEKTVKLGSFQFLLSPLYTLGREAVRTMSSETMTSLLFMYFFIFLSFLVYPLS